MKIRIIMFENRLAKCSQDTISTNGRVQLNAPVIPAILRSANKRITAQADPGIK
jgi:hypothetical protein